jgi:hypothetical protein
MLVVDAGVEFLGQNTVPVSAAAKVAGVSTLQLSTSALSSLNRLSSRPVRNFMAIS